MFATLGEIYFSLFANEKENLQHRLIVGVKNRRSFLCIATMLKQRRLSFQLKFNLYKYGGRAYIFCHTQLEFSHTKRKVAWSLHLDRSKIGTACAIESMARLGEALSVNEMAIYTTQNIGHQSMLLTGNDPCPRRRHSFIYMYFATYTAVYVHIHILHTSINVYLHSKQLILSHRYLYVILCKHNKTLTCYINGLTMTK